MVFIIAVETLPETVSEWSLAGPTQPEFSRVQKQTSFTFKVPGWDGIASIPSSQLSWVGWDSIGTYPSPFQLSFLPFLSSFRLIQLLK